MKIRLAGMFLFALGLSAAQAQAQADWTIRVGLRLTGVSSEITQGAVMCVAYPALDESVLIGLPSQMESAEAAGLASPGEAITEFPGLNAVNGEFVGYTVFDFNDGGTAPTGVEVQIIAPPGTTIGQKKMAKQWGCALGLRVAGQPTRWFSDPATYSQAGTTPSDLPSVLEPANFSEVRGVSVGSLGGS